MYGIQGLCVSHGDAKSDDGLGVDQRDLQARVQLGDALHEVGDYKCFVLGFNTNGGLKIAVAHDRYFIENFATAIWELRDGELSGFR